MGYYTAMNFLKPALVRLWVPFECRTGRRAEPLQGIAAEHQFQRRDKLFGGINSRKMAVADSKAGNLSPAFSAPYIHD
jgi:hypothetical protein